MPASSPLRRLTAVALLLAVMRPGVARAEGGAPDSLGRLHPGAIEVGVAGSLTTVEGQARATLALRCGGFVGTRLGLMGGEIEPAYSHVSALDTYEVQAAVTWQAAPGARPPHVFIAIGGGVRQEHLGSFSDVRYPVGCGVGLRLFMGPRAAFRSEYRYRRVLHDPVADFSEHQVLVGLSAIFRNSPAAGPR